MRRRRILVIANETLADPALREEILRRTGSARTEVVVVCPALNSRLRHWCSDDDGARARAGERLAASLAALADAGVVARGEIGDADPFVAFLDALRTFEPDEVVVSTHPRGRSNWLERGLVARARAASHVPVTHVVAGAIACGGTEYGASR